MVQYRFTSMRPDLEEVYENTSDTDNTLKSTGRLTDSQKLKKLSEQSKKVLLKFKSHPILPIEHCTVTIDENKINIYHHDLLRNNSLHSIPIKNITNLTVECSPLYASLNITDGSNQRYPLIYHITHLRHSDAHRARKLIQGLVFAQQQNIDLAAVRLQDIEEELEEIGEAKTIE